MATVLLLVSNTDSNTGSMGIHCLLKVKEIATVKACKRKKPSPIDPCLNDQLFNNSKQNSPKSVQDSESHIRIVSQSRAQNFTNRIQTNCHVRAGEQRVVSSTGRQVRAAF